MPDESAPDRPPEPPSGPRPLSRSASRLFVIASLLFILIATIGGTYFLVNMTSRALNAPMDTTATESVDAPQRSPADTLSSSERP